jgi:hypothetical protein
MTSLTGSMVATMVMKTTKVNKIVKANEPRSPDATGMQNTSKFTNIETQATSKLSMEFLDSVSFYFFLVVLSLQVITYFAIIQSRNNL